MQQFNQPAKSGMTFTRPAAVAFANIEVPIGKGDNQELRKLAKGAPIQGDTNNPVDRSLLNAALMAQKAGREPVSLWVKLTVQLVPNIDPNAPDLDLAFIDADPIFTNSDVNTESGEMTNRPPVESENPASFTQQAG